MTLHIFNPEHDIALASGLANFTAPHAGRQLRHDLGFLPALWASEGDAIVVDDVDTARRAWSRLGARLAYLGFPGFSARKELRFLPWKTALSLAPADGLAPWGWDAALRAVLLRRGIALALLPTEPELETIRQLSHRRLTALLLPQLRQGRADVSVGEATECREATEVEQLLRRQGRVVVKSPWSSSGRGLRFLDNDRDPIGNNRWLHNVLAAQGSVMVEPQYNKVKDLAMEFHSDGEGGVEYRGLSLFHTQNGAYQGNVVATEAAKRQLLARYVPTQLIDGVQRDLCRLLGTVLSGKYRGPLGVDMMVVGAAHGDGFLLHPCVEVNLRRTMGHAALALTPQADDALHVMRIDYVDNSYKLKINRL